MADFPRIKFKEFDGRPVPFTEPQHFTGNGDETARTGNENPLPTADYGMTESGVWIPKKVSDDGAQLTQVTGSDVEEGIITQDKKKVEVIEIIPRQIATENITSRTQSIDVDATVTLATIELKVYGVTGTFKEGEGYELTLQRQTRPQTQQYRLARSGYHTGTGNKSGSLFTVSPTINTLSVEGGRFQNVQDSPYPSMRPMIWIEGTFEDGEGIDVEVTVTLVH